MKPMMQNRYVGWMAIRPLLFGDEYFEPGDRVPQKHLEGMRDPEVLVRTGRLAAVATNMNKVPRYLRKDVTDAEDMLKKILSGIGDQIGEIIPRHLLQFADLEDMDDTRPDPDEDEVLDGAPAAVITDTDDAQTIAQIAPGDIEQPQVENADGNPEATPPAPETHSETPSENTDETPSENTEAAPEAPTDPDIQES